MEDTVTCSSEITLETDTYSNSSPIPPEKFSIISLHPEKHSSCNVIHEARSNTSDSTSGSSSNETVPSHKEQTLPRKESTSRHKPKIISVKSVDLSDSSSQKSNESSNGEMERMKRLRKRVAANNKIEVLPQKVEKSNSPKKGKLDASRKEKSTSITNDGKTVAKNTGERKPQDDNKKIGKQNHRSSTEKEEKSTNSNACSEESDNSNEGSDKKEKQVKSEARKKVAFNEESIDARSTGQRSEQYKELYKAERIINTEKIHPAISKRSYKLKCEKNFNLRASTPSDEFGKEKGVKKIKPFKKEVIDSMYKQEASIIKLSEQQLQPAWGTTTTLADKPIEDRPIMTVGPAQTAHTRKVSVQPGRTSIDKQPKVAETPWSTAEKFEDSMINVKDKKKLKKEKVTRLNVLKGDGDESDGKRPSPIGRENKEQRQRKKQHAKYTVPNNSDNSSNDNLSENQNDDFDLDELRRAAKSLVTESTSMALDFVEGVEWDKKGSKEGKKYQSNLSKITEEKEKDKKTKILRKIYDEVNVDHKPPLPAEKVKERSSWCDTRVIKPVYEYETTDDESDVEEMPETTKLNTVIIPKPRVKPPAEKVKEKSSWCDTRVIKPVYEYETTDDESDVEEMPKTTKLNTVIIPKPRVKPPAEKVKERSSWCDTRVIKPVYEYETTDDESDVEEMPKTTKTNTVIIPKPRVKPDTQTNVRECKLEKDQPSSSVALDDYSIHTAESTNLEKYSTADFINDLDTCLGDFKPSKQREITKSKSAAPRPKETTLAPNPFPMSKNNLPVVCPPKTEKPKYRRRIQLQNPLLAGVEDHPAIQRISAPEELGKLKEVKNREEPTPEIFLRTGKKETRKVDDTMPLTNYQRPIGKLQAKGRDSSMVDVKFFTEQRDPRANDRTDPKDSRDTSSQDCLYPMPDNMPHDLTPLQKQNFSKMQCTFKARDKNLPDAKFWTDLAKGNLPEQDRGSFELEPPKERKCEFSPWPIAPIGLGGNDGYRVGITDSEAELNKNFFSKVATKPQFYQKSKQKHQESNSYPLDDIPSSDTYKSTPQENLDFFRNVATDPNFRNKGKEKPKPYIPKTPTRNILLDEDHVINAKENLDFFRRISKDPEFFKKKNESEKIDLPRSYFNEPPLGVDEELPGRHHSREKENLDFFLHVSRNATAFYSEPGNPYEEETNNPSTTSSYQPQRGFIPDDPKNYVDEETAENNLKFFRNLAKDRDFSQIENKKASRKSGKKRRKQISFVENGNDNGNCNFQISKEKAEENLRFFREMSQSAKQGFTRYE
ncbi:uncharacterized protein LOC127729017 [Mytilus californianus]|uniref:uncharacterized protein LOC127729017 n=1 Tax=Mytilus californianus TaxID=6549 RepID=UPI0022455417|nr:uncharacterized protein LOC127729017 [Mytilus californianus]